MCSNSPHRRVALGARMNRRSSMPIRTGAALLAACLLLAACHAYKAERSPATGPARIEAPTAEVGRSWSFRVVNGYNGEVVAHYRERLVEATGSGLKVVRTDTKLGEPITELYTSDWNWLSKARPGVGVPTAYAPALVVLPFPLEVGRSWSQRSVSNDPHSGQQFAVRVDGRVVGWEQIRIPAGTFEAVLITRTIYVGDGNYERSDTEFIESDWYAPSVGRVVRAETTSGYYDLYHYSPPFGRTWVRGDWNVLELADPLGDR
jgi:hypothetical protein